LTYTSVAPEVQGDAARRVNKQHPNPNPNPVQCS